MHPEPAPSSKTLPTKLCMHHRYLYPSPLGKTEFPKKATTAVKWTDLTNHCVLCLLGVGFTAGRDLHLADKGGDGGHRQNPASTRRNHLCLHTATRCHIIFIVCNPKGYF